MGEGSIPVADAGLQPERTSLSWTRTALAMTVCSLTLLRWSSAYSRVVFPAIGVLTVLAVIIAASNRVAYRVEAAGVQNERVNANVVGVTAVTLGMTVLGAIGVFLVVRG